MNELKIIHVPFGIIRNPAGFDPDSNTIAIDETLEKRNKILYDYVMEHEKGHYQINIENTNWMIKILKQLKWDFSDIMSRNKEIRKAADKEIKYHFRKTVTIPKISSSIIYFIGITILETIAFIRSLMK